MKEVTSSNTCAFDASCRREFEKVNAASSGTIPSQSCDCAKYYVVWRLATFILYVFLAHQATDWLFKEKKSLLKSKTYAKTSKPLMMFPDQNSIVFYYKTTMWSFLSWTTCSHVSSRTNSCFGACYRSSSPESLATLSRRLVLQPFFSRHVVKKESCYQSDLNLRQIWWLEHLQDLWCRSRRGWCSGRHT